MGGTKAFSFHLPTNIVFGLEEFSRLGEVVSRYGRKALLVTGKRSMRASGVLSKAEELLRASGVQSVLYDKIPPNPTVSAVDEGARLAVTEKCDVVVGLGGGSAMDSAKGIALVAVSGGSVWEYTIVEDPELRKPKGALPVVAVPTTSGTGSEVNPVSMVTADETKLKTGVVSSHVLPVAALVDPKLTVTMPPRVTASTGIDAFFHAVESYTSTGSNPLTETFVEKAIRLIAEYLPKAYREGSNLEARYNMALASMLAGMAHGHTGTTLLHGVALPLSGAPNAPHGETLAALAPEFLEDAASLLPEKFARIAELMGENIKGLPPEEAAEKGVERIKKLLKTVDLLISPRELGVTEVMLERLAKDVFKGVGVCLQAYPKPVKLEDILALYRKALNR